MEAALEPTRSLIVMSETKYIFTLPELERAWKAYLGHLALIIATSKAGWKPIGPHTHSQLKSEDVGD